MSDGQQRVFRMKDFVGVQLPENDETRRSDSPCNLILVWWDPCEANNNDPDNRTWESEDDLIKQAHRQRLEQCYGKISVNRAILH